MGNRARLAIDRGIPPSDLHEVPTVARTLEEQGYDGCWTGEINHDPFLPLVLAAEHTTRMQLGTSIAVAFARNPMIVAGLGWDLQSYSQGRFILGLGTQVQAHIEKRFSMPWGGSRCAGWASSSLRCRRSGPPGATTAGSPSRVSSIRTG